MKMFNTADNSVTMMNTQAGNIAILTLPEDRPSEPPTYSQTSKNDLN